MPKTRVRFVIQLPKILPKAIPNKRFFKACMVVASSGKEVPNAIMVAPITEGGKPRDWAIPIPLSTTIFHKNKIKPMAIRNLIIMKLISFLL